MRSRFQPPPTKGRDILASIRDALEGLLKRSAPAPEVKVEVEAPDVKIENIIEQPHKCGWVFRVTERDKNGNISTFTATPVHDRNGNS